MGRIALEMRHGVVGAVDGQRPEAAVQADPQWTRRERDPGVVLSPEQDEIATRAPGGDQ